MDNRIDQDYVKSLKALYRSLFKKEIDNIDPAVICEMEEEIERIREENLNLNIAIDFSVDNIHLTDGEGNILRVNNAFEERVGSRRQDIEGKNVKDMETEGAYKPSVVRMVMQEKRKLTMMQQGPSGKTITTSTPVFDQDGKLFRVVSNARLVEELALLGSYFSERVHDIEPDNCTEMKVTFESEVMKSLMKQMDYLTNVDSGILFTGASGTGKSWLARYLHEQSNRSVGRFMQINCAAIPENLMESELFGYEIGAFSGASRAGKPGLIELANKGTLFLDEIGDMPLALQSKLLQVIQIKQITRVGGEKPINLDTRIISATNRDLEEMIVDKTFRQDLYYRLNVIPIHIPALKERKEDIPPLIEWLTKKHNQRYQKNVILTQDVKSCLRLYEWPGNIREMENFIERLIVTNESGLATAEDLPNNILRNAKNVVEPIVIHKIIPLNEAIEEVERQLIINAYTTLKSSYKVAESLGISQSAAFRKIKKYMENETGSSEIN